MKPVLAIIITLIGVIIGVAFMQQKTQVRNFYTQLKPQDSTAVYVRILTVDRCQVAYVISKGRDSIKYECTDFVRTLNGVNIVNNDQRTISKGSFHRLFIQNGCGKILVEQSPFYNVYPECK